MKLKDKITSISKRKGGFGKENLMSNLWAGGKCGRPLCFPCKSEKGRNCWIEDVNYTLGCEECWVNVASYKGETGRNAYTRGLEYLNNLEDKNLDKSVLCCTRFTTIKEERESHTPWRWQVPFKNPKTARLWREFWYQDLKGRFWWIVRTRWEAWGWRECSIEGGGAVRRREQVGRKGEDRQSPGGFTFTCLK